MTKVSKVATEETQYLDPNNLALEFKLLTTTPTARERRNIRVAQRQG